MTSSKTNFDKFMNPKSIVVYGTNEIVINNLLGKSNFMNPTLKKYSKFSGKLKIVDPKNSKKKIAGVDTVSSLSKIKTKIDLLIITEGKLSEILEESKNIENVMVLSDEKLDSSVKNTLKKSNVSLLGPSSFGIINPHASLNASLASSPSLPGDVAVVSQSGALLDSLLAFSNKDGIGYSKLIGLGNMEGVELYEILEALMNDSKTKIILMHIEAIKNGREFMKVAKKVSAKKPIIVLKAGISKLGMELAQHHANGLVDSPEIYEAAFKQCGVVQVECFEEMFDLAKTFSSFGSWQKYKNQVAVVGDSGGIGVLIADYAKRFGISLVDLKEKTKELISDKLDTNLMNPLDLMTSESKNYKTAIEILANDTSVSEILVVQATQQDSLVTAKAVVAAKKTVKNKPIICCLMGYSNVEKAIDYLESNNIPVFLSPMRAMRAMKYLVK